MADARRKPRKETFRGIVIVPVGGFEVDAHLECGHVQRVNVRTLANANVGLDGKAIVRCEMCIHEARQRAHDYILDTWERMYFGGVQVEGPTHDFFVVTPWELKTGHRAERHKQCERERCFICEGGLTYCTICGALEGALLPKCPGRMLTSDEHDANYRDYCDGQGAFAQ